MQSFTETTVLYRTGKGNKKRFINMNNIAEMFSQEECSALLGLHACTGRDTCCAFTGTGKIKPIKVLQKNAKFSNMLARLGDSWEVSDDMVSDAEELTCVFYRKPHSRVLMSSDSTYSRQNVAVKIKLLTIEMLASATCYHVVIL